MPSRYWVGGTAAWDGTAGSKWAETSGGAGGFSVPTTADDVFFDAASSGTCTISSGNTGAKSINCTGFTGTITGSAAITVAGSITLDAGQTYTHTGTMTISGTGTLTTAGKTFSGVTVSGSGITVTLGDALNISTRLLTITQGTFTTNNYNVTANSVNSATASTRVVNFGSSTITAANGVDFSIAVGFTLNSGTSQINVTSNSSTFQGGGLSYYNLSFTNTSAGTRGITGANTFNDLSVTGPAAAGVVQVTFIPGQTINGTLSTTGTAGNRRVWFRGVTYGIAQTLTVNSAPSLTDADFRDIYVVGTAAPISGTRIGNRGYSRGITFSTPKNVYWNLAGAQNWSANGWAPSSGGTPNTDNFPLPQDTAIFDNTGSVTGTITLDAALQFTGSVDMSNRTTAMTLSFGSATTCYGSWTNGSGTTLSGTQTLTFSGEGTKTITCAGRSFSTSITVDAYAGTVELADALSAAGRTLTVTNGTFDTKDYNVNLSAISSSNTNVRTIVLGSSTITLGGASGTTFATTTNLTFNAGTSTINFTAGSTGTILNSGGVTFYDVSFTNGNTAITATITGNNTYRNLLFTAPSSAGLVQYSFSGDSTITGTLTCAGASAVRRIFVRSNTFGTTSTLTVGTLVADDCDFRDITITGTAAGSSPTRAGDLGGNSGITFPAPKTVYWNLSGAQNWSANAWAATSGGSPAVDNFPLAQDTAVFDEAGSVGTVTLLSTFATSAIDMSARTSAMTITTSTNTVSIYGDWKFGTGVTQSSTTGALTFVKRGTSTITSNGVTFNCPITINCVNNVGTVQLADAFVLDAARTLTLTSGTFDAVTHDVTIGLYSGSSGATLKMGSGLWTISGTGTVWSQSATLLKGTANILLSDNSTTARTFAGGGRSYNKLTIGGTTSTSTTTITGNNQFTELASTKTVAHTIALGATAQTFGKWSVTGTSGNVVTLTGTGTGHVIVGDATSGIDYLALGDIRFSANSPAEFYAGANSTATGVPIAPTFLSAPPAGRTLYWVGGTGNWNDTARWSLSSGGAGGEPTPTSLDDVIFDSGSNATGYTVTVNGIVGGNRIKSWTISGPTTGNVTLSGFSAAIFIHDNVTFPVTGLNSNSGASFGPEIVFTSSQTGRTITSNGFAWYSKITFNGIGCEWSLGSSFSNPGIGIPTGDIFVTNGSLVLNGYNLFAVQLLSSNNNSRTLDFGSSTVTLAGLNRTNPSFGGVNLNFISGTSQLNLTSNFQPFGGNGEVFYNVSFTSSLNTGEKIINGNNTFNNLSLTLNGVRGDIRGNQIVNGTFTCTGGSITSRGNVFSNVTGTERVITANAFSSTDCNFTDITLAGTAAGSLATGGQDLGGNTGITFPAPKTVYRVGTNTTWTGSNSWALTSGGSGSNSNIPLAQDTAIINEDTALTGTLSVSGILPQIDCSARTTGITLNFSGGSFFGSLILGSGVTVTGTGTQTFVSRSRTMTLTSAGKTLTFPITVAALGGTFELGDAITTTGAIDLSRGTLDAKTYNFTATTFSSSNSNTRTLAIGSGTWTFSGSGTSAWTAATSTGLTVTGTGVIKLTSASAKTFAGGNIVYTDITLDQGGTGALTISGNNTFKDIINTSGGATSILLTTSTQRVAQWTGTGTSGNVLTISGSSAASPATLILTGATDPNVDYLAITGIRAYDLIDTWYAGANSTNNGSLGWYFEAGTPPPPPVGGTGAMFLLFM